MSQASAALDGVEGGEGGGVGGGTILAPSCSSSCVPGGKVEKNRDLAVMAASDSAKVGGEI